MNIIPIIDYTNTYVNGTETNGQVYIRLIDAATGQPANGNNMQVTYQVNLDGVSNTYTILISGQGKAIYTGRISNINPQNYHYSSFTILSHEEVTMPPPVAVCDLQISHVNVDKLESAVGANDGQITAFATSSNGLIEYSTDNVNFQSSPTFGGLTGGIIPIYARDSNGCLAGYSVLLGTVTGLLVADPSVSLPGGKISRWNAAFNSIVFTYQRKDFGIHSSTTDTLTGYAKLRINASLNDPATGNPVLSTGDKVYINSTTYKGIYDVDRAEDVYNLIIKTPPIHTDEPISGFININKLRPYYNIVTRISYFDSDGRQKTITSTNRPDVTGLVKADLSSFLQSLVQPADESDYSLPNFRDDNLSASYSIAYAEVWDENGTTKEPVFVSLDHNYYVLYAAKQLGERYGGNLAAYVPFASLPDGVAKARWITDFAEPACRNGYPFDIGFIYSEDLLGRQLYCEFTLLDINRQPIQGGENQVGLLNEDGSWLLNQDGGRLVIATQGFGNIPVPDQLGLNRLLINTNLPSEVYYINLALKYNDNNVVHTVTQTQTIRVDDAVDDSVVYLRWIGLSGSWNYYRFVFNQEVTLDVQNAVIIKNFVHDWENQQGIEEVISKSAGQKMKVVAEDLSVADIKGLQSIKYSPKVQMLVNRNPVKWQTVVINTATYSEYETRNGRAPFSVTFNLPAINIQTQ
ncbi:hypothetical protein DYU05_08885 [Mucilaginibacter terrenus]|uniref:Uncharacterized protein n=1 Tax=Mucilaginibacter terrenus TaxID=2482727 RepID=A0A3E2NXE5_9SPHI|nr:hypothetical protein [Mucilaginibacter terrenus]RFZ85694.1 hypothetical protein DYU05_08885 [Mucilaginibacter terrenus]